MLNIGNLNTLKIARESEQGLYLSPIDAAAEDQALEILLPRRYTPKNFELGQDLEVFVSYDSEDRLIASTETPLAKVGQFAHLEVVAIEEVGAFLDWGMPKDLFLPYSEQTRNLRIGQDVVVFVYLDNSQRIAASMRLERHLDKTPGVYTEGQEVDLFIAAETDMGFKAIINGKHMGMLYSNEIFKPLEHGQHLKGYAKKPRGDGKIDLILEAVGYKAAADIGQKILTELKKENGYLPIDDKTSAELIYEMFGVSKKKYKIALGDLYKKRLIVIKDDGIRLV
jgi:predicted RNA-binding protein (virulence factor B family)